MDNKTRVLDFLDNLIAGYQLLTGTCTINQNANPDPTLIRSYSMSRDRRIQLENVAVVADLIGVPLFRDDFDSGSVNYIQYAGFEFYSYGSEEK